MAGAVYVIIHVLAGCYNYTRAACFKYVSPGLDFSIGVDGGESHFSAHSHAPTLPARQMPHPAAAAARPLRLSTGQRVPWLMVGRGWQADGAALLCEV